MKLEALNFDAFGPFTDKSLLFDTRRAGLHIVYGANEAGKSSALRGLKALLYGFETRTPDNFLHANDKLRISGRIINAEGHTLNFARRKGRINTLLNEASEPLDAQALTPFLQGVNAEVFQALFGIDHQALVQGGQEILEQKGKSGEMLFSASLGSHTLHTVQEQLSDEANALFRPKGSTQRINAALKSYAELKKQIREQSLSSRQWDEHRRRLERTRKALEKIQSELSEHRMKMHRLERFQRVLPKLARHREWLLALEPLNNVVILPADFAQRHQQAVKALETAQALSRNVTPRLEGLKTQLEGLSINQGLLDQADNIEDLRTRLGDYRKALQDQPHLKAERQQLLADAEFILKEVPASFKSSNLETLQPMLARRHSIAELGNQHALLVSQEKQMDASRRKTETQLKATRKAHQALPEIGCSDTLRSAIATARKLGDIDTAIQSAQSDCAHLETHCMTELSRLTLWQGDLQALSGLEVPDRESIHCFEERYSVLEKRQQRLTEKLAETVDAHQQASLQLDEMHQRFGAVPTETDLDESRSKRDQSWQLLCRQWQNKEDISTQIHQFAAQLTEADELSDRLRREADRVHTLASLQAKQSVVQKQTARITQQLSACADEKALIDTDWQTLWTNAAIKPQTPREMRAWLDNLDKLRHQLGQLQVLQQNTETLEQTRNSQIQYLNQQLEAAGQVRVESATLETVLLICEALTQQFDDIKQQHDTVNKALKELQTRLETLNDDHRVAIQALDTWTEQWQILTADFGLQSHAVPAEVSHFIEKIRDLLDKQNKAEHLLIRIKAIDHDADNFRTQVAEMVAHVAPELTELSVDNAVMRLHSLLSDNRSRLTQHQQIKEQLEQAQQDIQSAELTMQNMTDTLVSLCREAHCQTADELESAISRSAQCVNIKTALQALEAEILEAGGGASLIALAEETQAIDLDALPGQIQALSHLIDEVLEPRRTELAEIKGREEKELELMDGSDHVSELTEQAQAILASIRSDAERYLRVKLAGRILRDQIEQYRQQNQGPLVKRASEHFAALTLGSFTGLITDFNDKDEPILTGTRAAGERVTVAGMSSGTRDQLYLALRLASLEKYMEHAEAMPFIVDDILLEFDDLRSEAALNALVMLTQKTQVIMFTHHLRLVEQAKGLQKPVQVHEL